MNIIEYMAFKVRYKFKEDTKYYTCTLTLQQYKNFKELPTVVECKVIKKNQKNIDAYKKEIEKALQKATQKSIKNHIHKLSENA